METKNEIRIDTKSIYLPRLPKYIKRVAGFFLDLIIFVVILTGFLFATSAMFKISNTTNRINEKMDEYQINYVDEDGNKQYCDANESKECEDKWKAFYSDEEVKILINKRSQDALKMITISVVCTLVITDLIIPLCLKHGRTVGMFIFNMGLVSEEGIELPRMNFVIRFIFGRIICDFLIPIYCVMFIMFTMEWGLLATILLLCIIGANFYFYCINETHRRLHDVIGKSLVCDTTSQIYFKTKEELNKKLAEEALSLSKEVKK